MGGPQPQQTVSVVSVAALTAWAARQQGGARGGSSGPHSTATLVAPLFESAAVLACVACVAYRLYRSASARQEKHVQLKRAAQRLWRLATQGAEAAGPVPEDLGEPDAAGVYSRHSCTGTLFFRQARHYPGGGVHWEWSRDRAFWFPTSCADSLWYGTDSSPSQADKVLIRRLEVEGQLLARQPGSGTSCGGAAAAAALLPPLDVASAARDVSCLADVPNAFLCPISMRLMTQPVVTPSGATFDRPALLDWIRQTHTDPLSGQPLSSDQLVPNLVLRDMIHAWLLGDDAAAATPTPVSGSCGSDGATDSASSSSKQQPCGVPVVDVGSSSSGDGCWDAASTPATPVVRARAV